MKAKKILRETDDFKKAINDVQKEDDEGVVWAKVPYSLFVKLKKELIRRRMSMAKWVREKVEEI